MIEVKELKKVYKTKGGVDVHALDGISIKFPEKGMVFLLGRSGSGKSTLLNVTGGLDKPDSGEIIVKGRSSLDFTPADFDSYRNTFVGFIFQEYNVLNDFTIEQNIALALQLQGKPNDREAVNAILEQVDLHGLGKRKPNTLSGGQKQRVAIARALIKNPDIIMADEPTGALDSNTGKQVLDTLKKLSEDKLVIVVSHDREFANTYADRIIELKDGKVVSDRTRELIKVADNKDNVTISENSVAIKNGSKVTDAEIESIITAIKKNKGEVVIATGSDDIPEVKKACKIEAGTIKESFEKTTKVNAKEYDGNQTKFIKSRLPMSHAFKIGVSSLKVKPVRLAFTILLSVIAFVLFGVLSTMMMYNPIYSISESLKDSAYQDIVLTKTYDVTKDYHIVDEEGNISSEVAYSENVLPHYTWFSQEEIDKLNDNDLGLDFVGVFTCGKTTYSEDNIVNYDNSAGLALSFQNEEIKNEKILQHYYNVSTFSGFTDCGPEYLQRQGFTLHGEYPKNKSEIAVSEYIFRMLLENYYANRNMKLPEDIEYDQYYQTIIGKKIKFDERIQNLTIVGVYEMKIPEKYQALKVSVNLNSLTDELKAMRTEFGNIVRDSFYTIGFVSEDFYDAYYAAYNEIAPDYRYGVRMNTDKTKLAGVIGEGESSATYTEREVNRYPDNFMFYNTAGQETEFSLGEKQAYLSAYVILGDSGYINRFLNSEIYKNNCSPGKKYYTFMQAINSYRSVDKSYHSSDIQVILSTILSDYNSVVEGSKLPDLSKLYLKTATDKEETLTVVGFYFSKTSKFSNCRIISKDYLDTIATSSLEQSRYSEKTDGYVTTKYYSTYSTNYVMPESYKYDRVITKTNNEKAQTYFMLENSPEFTKYRMTNSLYAYAEEMSDQVADLSLIFLAAGLAAGVLASLMFLNFISVSIAAKRKEIGVLRAVGARGSDVFKIFFTEALVIALICFIIAAVASGYACVLINTIMMESEIMIKLFDYNVWSVLIVFVVSMFVSLLATFIPVRSAAKKPPVDSIREL